MSIKKKKKTRKRKIKNEISSKQALLVERKSYKTGLFALNRYLNDLMDEYNRIYRHVKTPNHPILEGLLEQVQLINDIVNCLESGIINGNPDDKRDNLQ